MTATLLLRPLQVEVEFTNVCNAHCTACPRSDMPRAGMLTEETLDRILEPYRGTALRVTVAGGGEPLIHRRAPELLERIVAAGFETTLITNASQLTPERTERILRLGLGLICVSFWGVEEGEYERAMRLPYKATLEKVEHLALRARETGTPVLVLWVRSPEISSSDESIEAFWRDRGIEVDMGDNDPWNRGGLVGQRPGTPERGHLPDPSRRIWCADFFFSDAYTWAGDCILCCCNYFTSKQICIGNVWEQDARELARRKAGILDVRPLPAMCQVCRLPRDKRAAWLAAPVLDTLTPEDRAMLLEYPAAPVHDER
jgi:Radical SAM superfamily/4Fe-4S single cluster domain